SQLAKSDSVRDRISQDEGGPLAGVPESTTRISCALKPRAESLRVFTLPDVWVALWIELEIEPALLLENGWKPRIVAPVRFPNHGIVWLLLPQKFINGVFLPAGVPVGPKFRPFLSDRGA